MNEPGKIEQLWYTWSDVGLETINAGYRIRAVSPGLSDLRSERVGNLSPYLRYALPPGTNPIHITLAMAPVSLTFVNMGTDRVLIRKVYTGRDAVGRYGVFFAHALIGLPPEFTAKDAIELWNAEYEPGKGGIWRRSDAELGRRETELPRISFEDLLKMRRSIVYTPQQAERIRTYLPITIRAYLEQRRRTE